MDKYKKTSPFKLNQIHNGLKWIKKIMYQIFIFKMRFMEIRKYSFKIIFEKLNHLNNGY
jgi:hypothetical protein